MEDRDSKFIWKVLFVIFLLFLVGVIFYFVGKNVGKSKNCEECTECANNVGERDTKAHQYGKSTYNGHDVNYRIYAVDYNIGLVLLSNPDKKSMTVTVDRDSVKNYFNVDIGSNSEFVKTFGKEIKQIYVGYFGNAIGQECVLLLMADGTIEYIPLLKEFSNPNWKDEGSINKFNSHGTISGVTNVVELVYLKVESSTGDYYSVGAVRKDGTLYDLMEFVPNMDL